MSHAYTLSTLTRRGFARQILSACAVAGMGTALRADQGAALVTLSDGHLTLPPDMLFGTMPQDELSQILAAHDTDPIRYQPACNVTLLRDGDRTVLFDVGAGPDFMASAGQLPQALEQIGLAPEDVTHVVFTHAHPDHIWGLLDDFDEPMFPDATYMMGRAEWEYWWDPDTVSTIGEARASFAVGAKRRMQAIEDRVVRFDDGQEILPGIAARACFGHTPGHMGFEIRTDGVAAMVVGDAIGNPHVAFARPDWASGSDQDPDMAVAARLSLLDQLASDQIPLIGYHLPNGGAGRVVRQDGAYRFIGEPL